VTNAQIAQGLLAQAANRIEAARQAKAGGAAAFTVRLSQECVELSLKAALYMVGIDPPKWHDVGEIVQHNRGRYPSWFGDHVADFAQLSLWLREERELSMYGDEERGIPAQELYDEGDARAALLAAEQVFAACKRLIESGSAPAANDIDEVRHLPPSCPS
jgi:HEPN domain-containing protein